MKRMISLLLVFTMLVSILPVSAFGEEFFSEESFGAATFEDSTFFESEDFSAFFAQENEPADVPALPEPELAFEESVIEIQEEPVLEEPAAEEEPAEEAPADEAAEEMPAEEAPADEAEDGNEDAMEAVPEMPEENGEEESGAVILASVEAGVILYKDAEMSEILGTVSEKSVVSVQETMETEAGRVCLVQFNADGNELEGFVSEAAIALLSEEEAASVAVPVLVFLPLAEEAADEVEEEDPEEAVYEPWYARIAKGSILYEDAGMMASTAALKEDAIVLVKGTESVELDEDFFMDVLMIEYLADEKVVSGFIPAAAAVRVEEEEAAMTPVIFEAPVENRDLEFAMDLESRASKVTSLKVVPGKSTSDGATGKVYLKWEESSASDAEGYRLRYSTAPGDLEAKTCSHVNWSTGDIETDDDGNDWCFAEVDNLSVGDTYYFAVVILDAYGNPITEISNIVSWTISPNAPQNLKASQTVTDAGKPAVKLTWKKVENATGYIIYRGDKRVAILYDADTLEYIDGNSLKIGNTYVYKVYSYIYTGSGSFTSGDPEKAGSQCVISSSFTKVEISLKPSTPTNPKATSVSTTSIKVTWTPVTGVSGYRIYYALGSTVSTDSTFVDVSGATTKETIIPDLSPLQQYSFMIASYVDEGVIYDEDGAVVEHVRVVGDPTSIFKAKAVPGVIQNVKAVYSNETGKITLSWDKYAEVLSKYKIYWGTSITGLTNTEEVDYVQTTFTMAASVGTTYYFKIVGMYDTTEGVLDDATLVWVTAFPDQPKDFVVLNGALTTDKKASADLSWSAVADADGYIYQRDTKSNFATSGGDKDAGSSTSVNDAPLAFGTTYYYRVCAYVLDPNGEKVKGPWSEVKSIKGSPEDPTFDTVEVLKARTQYCGIMASWNAVEGAEGYYVSLLDLYTGKIVGKEIKLVGNGNLSYTFTGLTAGEPYDVIVKSYKGTGISSGKSWIADNDPLVPPLYVPETLTATAVSPSSVKISWSKIYGVTGYHVFVRAFHAPFIYDSTFTNIDLDTTATSYTITGLRTGYPYLVEVSTYSKAQGTDIYTKDVNTFNGLIGDVTEVIPENYVRYKDADGHYYVKAVPETPSSLKVSLLYNASNEPYAHLSWNLVTGLENGGYLITRLVDGSPDPATPFKINDPSINTYDDTTLGTSMIGKTITYIVQSYIDPMSEGSSGVGYTVSEKSNTASLVLSIQKPVLHMDNTDDGYILVKWDEVWGASGYEVYRATSKSYAKAVKIKSLAATELEYEDTDSSTFKVGKAYYYYVKVLTAGTVSDAGVGKRSGPPPTGLDVTYNEHFDPDVYARSIKLEWSAPSGGTPSGYTIYSSIDLGVTWKKIGTVGKNKLTYTAKNLIYQQEYTFAVTANYAGSSTSTKCIMRNDPTDTETTALTRIYDLKAVNTNTTVLSWEKVPNATGYKIVVIDPNPPAGSNGIKVYTSGTNKYTVKGLEPAKQYDAYVYPYIKYNGVEYPASKITDDDPTNWGSELAEYYATLGFAYVYVGPKATSSISLTMTQDSGKDYVYASWKPVTVANQMVKYRVALMYTDDTIIEEKSNLDVTNYRFGEGTPVVPLATNVKVVVQAYYEDSGKTYWGAEKVTGKKKTK